MTICKNSIILFTVICSIGTAKPAKAQETKDILNRLQQTYETTKTIQAEFRQESTLSSLGQKQFAEGKVFIKKPGMMRWEYEKPEKQLIITDNKNIIIYIPEDNQVIKDQMNDMSTSSVPAAFLSGNAHLKEKFDIIYNKDKHYNTSGSFKLILTPKIPQPSLSELTLIINSKSYQIEESSIKDIYNNTTAIYFSNIVINKNIPDDIFNFKIPEGVEIISPPMFQ